MIEPNRIEISIFHNRTWDEEEVLAAMHKRAKLLCQGVPYEYKWTEGVDFVDGCAYSYEATSKNTYVVHCIEEAIDTT